MMMIVDVIKTCILRSVHLSQHEPPGFDYSVNDRIYGDENDRARLQQ